MFAQHCMEKLNEPVSIPDSPEFRGAQLIKSTKGNLVAMLYGSSKVDSITKMAKRNVEKRGRERLNKTYKRELYEHKLAHEREFTQVSVNTGDSPFPSSQSIPQITSIYGSPITKNYHEMG